MSEFTIYPAIDLRDGRVVRLQHGDPNQQTTFSDDPVAIAQKWVAAGATWLHVVNLDGAFDEAGTATWQILPQLTQRGAKVQFGGGVRSLADVARVLAAGVTRVVLGTVAIEQPEMVAEAIAQFGAEHIAVGIDARDGVVKTRGWVKDTAVSPIELGTQMKAIGVQTVIYTDISRDGVLAGVNVSKTAELAQATGLHVIASGGVASLQDINKCLHFSDQGIVGAIIGRAIYDGKVNLLEAISLSKLDFGFCRVCGYKNFPPSWGINNDSPDFTFCTCCGVEAGYQDSTPESTRKYREQWLADGAKWNHSDYKPPNWDLNEQLKNTPTKSE